MRSSGSCQMLENTCSSGSWAAGVRQVLPAGNAAGLDLQDRSSALLVLVPLRADRFLSLPVLVSARPLGGAARPGAWPRPGTQSSRSWQPFRLTSSRPGGRKSSSETDGGESIRSWSAATPRCPAPPPGGASAQEANLLDWPGGRRRRSRRTRQRRTASLACRRRARPPRSAPPGGRSGWGGPQAAPPNICPGRDAASPPSERTPASALEPRRPRTFLMKATWLTPSAPVRAPRHRRRIT